MVSQGDGLLPGLQHLCAREQPPLRWQGVAETYSSIPRGSPVGTQELPSKNSTGVRSLSKQDHQTQRVKAEFPAALCDGQTASSTAIGEVYAPPEVKSHSSRSQVSWIWRVFSSAWLSGTGGHSTNVHHAPNPDAMLLPQQQHQTWTTHIPAVNRPSAIFL